MSVCERSERSTFFSVKGIQKGYLFSQIGLQKGKGLDLGVGPPQIELCILFKILTSGLFLRYS